jgi:hypothetical protein
MIPGPGAGTAGARIVLATLNARWSHCAFGLRYLLANLGELQAQAAIREFTIHDQPAKIVERLLADAPLIVGLGVYIWNRRESESVARILKQVAPQIKLVIGGPEPTHAPVDDPLRALADVTIAGEADIAFREVCTDLLAGRPVAKLVTAAKPDPATLVLPYHLYTDQDLAHRLIYVEASRGCPFTCEFCLSSIENGVRTVPLDPFLAALDDLLARGCRTFKFVDRTFNLAPRTAIAILTFFQERWRDGLFLHFEMVPDRLPDEVKALLAWFPAGAVQLEIGIQSFTPAVGELISRRMHRGRTEANLAWLRDHSGIHVHADLIIGLPGETPASFQESFDALWHLTPGEIQVGILKLLPGTPLARHVPTFAMQFSSEPPYELLAAQEFPFPLMQRLKRFARYFDLFANSGGFRHGLELAISHGPSPSPFAGLLAFSDWLWITTGQDHAIAKPRLYDLLAKYLDHLGVPPATTDDALAQDAVATGCTALPDRLHAPAERWRRNRAQGILGP